MQRVNVHLLHQGAAARRSRFRFFFVWLVCVADVNEPLGFVELEVVAGLSFNGV